MYLKMNHLFKYILIYIIISFLIQCAPVQNSQSCIVDKTDRMHGLSFVAPPEPFPNNPMPAVKAVDAAWIAVIPYGYSLIGDSKVYYNTERQWWGERREGIEETLRLAKAANLKIMLKPQLYIPGSWTGDWKLADEASWLEWENGYEKFIFDFLELAVQFDVELFCVGTEFKKSVEQRPEFWRKLILNIRKKYKGKLTYAANWDNYQNIPFWEQLDFVGIDAYFPLNESKTPDKKILIKAWQKPLSDLDSFHCKVKKPILFTEFGYLCVDGCAGKNWILEKNINKINQNEIAQATALDALFEVWWENDWWAGGFIWKWFPNMRGHEGYPGKDYTPQGKAAENILKKWYSLD